MSIALGGGNPLAPHAEITIPAVFTVALAIVTALTLRLIFHLALRQTEGVEGRWGLDDVDGVDLQLALGVSDTGHSLGHGVDGGMNFRQDTS